MSLNPVLGMGFRLHRLIVREWFLIKCPTMLNIFVLSKAHFSHVLLFSFELFPGSSTPLACLHPPTNIPLQHVASHAFFFLLLVSCEGSNHTLLAAPKFLLGSRTSRNLEVAKSYHPKRTKCVPPWPRVVETFLGGNDSVSSC